MSTITNNAGVEHTTSANTHLGLSLIHGSASLGSPHPMNLYTAPQSGASDGRTPEDVGIGVGLGKNIMASGFHATPNTKITDNAVHKPSSGKEGAEVSNVVVDVDLESVVCFAFITRFPLFDFFFQVSFIIINI